jgi:hypothetical protein
VNTGMIEHLHRLAAHAYYCGEHDAGRRACERLMRLPLSAEKEEKVRSNRTWYTRTLSDQGVAAEFTKIDVPPARVGWSLFNPSVVSHGDRLLVNVRSSNYRIDENGRYVIPPEDREAIRTFNCLVEPGDGHARYWAADYEASGFAVTGLEDVRLNSVEGELIASATIRNWADRDGTCRIGVGKLETFDRIQDLRCHDTVSGRHEKNWMPITGRREWLYSCSHEGRTCIVNECGDDWTVTAHAEAPLVARGFRGGSQLVEHPWAPGLWWAIVHEVAVSGGRRVYEHRFVMFDEGADWRITRVSQPFAFRETRSIEFAAGLAVSGQDTLVASFGVRDAEAWLAYVPIADVLNIMGDAWE